jgi:orotate phosphoribosyltransferase
VEELHTRVARALLEINAVGFSPDKPITFKSGILSPVYVDNRILPFHPVQWHTVIEGFETVIAAEGLNFDVLAGVAVGGIPHSSALAYTMGRPSVFVRKEAKEHGKQQRIEGGDVRGKRVLLVEDLVTTGSSSLDGITALRAEGAAVEHVLAIVSYGLSESQRNFAEASINLHTLTNFTVILEEALMMGKLGQAEMAVINDWFKDPYAWRRSCEP